VDYTIFPPHALNESASHAHFLRNSLSLFRDILQVEYNGFSKRNALTPALDAARAEAGFMVVIWCVSGKVFSLPNPLPL